LPLDETRSKMPDNLSILRAFGLSGASNRFLTFAPDLVVKFCDDFAIRFK